uniref:Uncharacterized protein n=1 Tax=Oryza sativa subsp. japonica TaxID=39947 RepID=Q69V54_ORYSJ|nr:hypothetical protein [Oryza sativa Japonica Group]
MLLKQLKRTCTILVSSTCMKQCTITKDVKTTKNNSAMPQSPPASPPAEATSVVRPSALAARHRAGCRPALRSIRPPPRLPLPPYSLAHASNLLALEGIRLNREERKRKRWLLEDKCKGLYTIRRFLVPVGVSNQE